MCSPRALVQALELVVPPRSLHVATSFNMIGWLDSKPDAPPPEIHRTHGTVDSKRAGLGNRAEPEAVPPSGRNRSSCVLPARGTGARPGGKLLLQVFGRTETHSTSDGIYDALSDALLDLIDNGVLAQRVYEDLVFPVYFRTLKELTAPIEADSDLARAFRIDKAATIEVDAPFNAEHTRTGDIQTWAKSYTSFLRRYRARHFRRLAPNSPRTRNP